MKAFEWANATSVDEAVKLLTPASPKMDSDTTPRALGGGQDLLTTMKAYIERPPRVVNLKTIKGLDHITDDGKGGLKIGATATLTAIHENPDIQKGFPGLSEAAYSIATPQIRNLGTLGGNLCQRPRCWYFRLENYKCLKKGGTECFASSGDNKYNAILGGGPSFIVHPSDMAPMLISLGATVTIAGKDGQRTIPLETFFILPTETPRRENVLKDGEIITEIQIPATAARSTYVKFKERDSLDFAMASVAAVVEFGPDKTVKDARLTLGGVAPIPWVAKDAAASLVGKKLDGDTIKNAATLAVADASPLDRNGYKVILTQTLIRRALNQLNA
ncbi:MAG TPA: xanthine dehydrogenase family protein subunit M [Phycisphaerae bacterium]|nr:xanthine dehydrogenase family protein subunit M [Phycisphaerae bacterium]